MFQLSPTKGYVCIWNFLENRHNVFTRLGQMFGHFQEKSTSMCFSVLKRFFAWTACKDYNKPKIPKKWAQHCFGVKMWGEKARFCKIGKKRFFGFYGKTVANTRFSKRTWKIQPSKVEGFRKFIVNFLSNFPQLLVDFLDFKLPWLFCSCCFWLKFGRMLQDVNDIMLCNFQILFVFGTRRMDCLIAKNYQSPLQNRKIPLLTLQKMTKVFVSQYVL